MDNLVDDNKKKNSITTTTFVLSATILVIVSFGTPLAITHLLQSAEAQIGGLLKREASTTTDEPSKAPVVVSGDNIYLAWWTNSTSENGNEEVMFRA